MTASIAYTEISALSGNGNTIYGEKNSVDNDWCMHGDNVLAYHSLHINMCTFRKYKTPSVVKRIVLTTTGECVVTMSCSQANTHKCGDCVAGSCTWCRTLTKMSCSQANTHKCHCIHSISTTLLFRRFSHSPCPFYENQIIWSQIVLVHGTHTVKLFTIRRSPFPVCLFDQVSLKNLPLQICWQLNSHWSDLLKCVCVCVCVTQYIYVIFFLLFVLRSL